MVGSQREAQPSRWCACHSDCVITVCFDLGWEPREALLASVEAIPDMVHHAVESVRVASCVVGDDDRLDTPVIGVPVQRLKQKHAEFAVRALVGLPVGLADAAVVALRCAFIVRDYLESSVSLVDLPISVGGSFK